MKNPADTESSDPIRLGRGAIHQGDAVEVLRGYPAESFQAIVADPPYFQVLLDHEWDTRWRNADDYLAWTREWVGECRRLLKPDGLLYIFGQLGKREHVWLHMCSQIAAEMPFHDMIIWDRAVGYNERSDSFTPQYEMILALRREAGVAPFFNKDAVRVPYDEKTIQLYLRDNRYKDLAARERHLRKGRYATNIFRVPSLKGNSGEKVGHPSQKPVALIEKLILSSSREGDRILDPFLGSGTTAVCCEALGRPWVGVESDARYVAIAERRLTRWLERRNRAS